MGKKGKRKGGKGGKEEEGGRKGRGRERGKGIDDPPTYLAMLAALIIYSRPVSLKS